MKDITKYQKETNTIELYLITGFLGSGKTTFIKNMMNKTSQKKTGILVNEFGSVGIDGRILKNDDVKLVEINNGSIFCACLKGEFVNTLAAFLQQPVERLFIEASGMADPSSMLTLLEQLTPLLQKKYKTNRRYHYRGSICVVDAEHFLELSECIIAIDSQVEKSGFIVLNKIDTISKVRLHTLHKELRYRNKDAFIYDTTYADVPEEILTDMLCNESGPVAESKNTCLDRPYVGVLTIPPQKDVTSVRSFLTEVTPYLNRVKGFFMCGEHWMHVECVSQDIHITKWEGSPQNDCNKLILICAEDGSQYTRIYSAWNQYFMDEFLFEEE